MVVVCCYLYLGDYFRSLWGPFAGWAQSVSFCSVVRLLNCCYDAASMHVTLLQYCFRVNAMCVAKYKCFSYLLELIRQRICAVITIIIRSNRCCSASDSAYCNTFIRSVVCLTVVCLSRSCPCLNSMTDLDAIWQVHLWGPVTHCVRWGFMTPYGKERFGVKPKAEACSCKLQPNRSSYAATWQIQTRSFVDLPQQLRFCQITSVLVFKVAVMYKSIL